MSAAPNLQPFIEALEREHGSRLIPLAAICDKLLGINYEHASKLAGRGELELPAFRLRATRKGPLLCRAEDVAAILAARYEEALAVRSAVRGWAHE